MATATQDTQNMQEMHVRAYDNELQVTLHFTGAKIPDLFGPFSAYLTESDTVIVVLDTKWLTWDSTEEFGEWVSDTTRDNLGQEIEYGLTDAPMQGLGYTTRR